MTANELSTFLRQLADEVLSDSAEIIAATASDYYRDRFRDKAFDGKPWTPGLPKRRGSLLVASGALANSIVIAEVSRQRVVISAGNAKVPYAQAHNEGFSGRGQVPAHTRNVRGKSFSVRTHVRGMRIPQRRFMGESQELNAQIHARLTGYVQSLNKK